MNKIFLGLLIFTCLSLFAPLPSMSTVSSQVASYSTGFGDGATVSFAISGSLCFQSNSDIQVVLEDQSTTPYSDTILSQGVGAGKYQITGSSTNCGSGSNAIGTTIVMGTAPSTTQFLIISRGAQPFTQTVHYYTNSVFPAAGHEAQMDKNVMLIQNLNAHLSPNGVTPGAAGNVLTSTGTTWQSLAPAQNAANPGSIQAASTVFAGPTTGANAVATFRFLAGGDIPVVGKAPVVLESNNIDWSKGNIFTKTLSASAVLTFSNQSVGQTITTIIKTTAANFTASFPSSVSWPSGNSAIPSQILGAHTDVTTMIYDGASTYINQVQNF